MKPRKPFHFLTIVAILFMTLRVPNAQDLATPSTTIDLDQKTPLKIVPIVTLKPGETTKLMLSTYCTVGLTRGRGFMLEEMRNGKPTIGQTEGHEGASYRRDGIEIRIPGWDAAEKFASTPAFAALKEQGVQVFEVTVSASRDAKLGLVNMHLVDATCTGSCETDFRVLVVSQ